MSKMNLEVNAIYKYHFVKLKMEKIIVKNAVQDIILILLHQVYNHNYFSWNHYLL